MNTVYLSGDVRLPPAAHTFGVPTNEKHTPKQEFIVSKHENMEWIEHELANIAFFIETILLHTVTAACLYVKQLTVGPYLLPGATILL